MFSNGQMWADDERDEKGPPPFVVCMANQSLTQTKLWAEPIKQHVMVVS